MLSPPLPCSSPALHSAVQLSYPFPQDISRVTHTSARPLLKRQATAPLPSSSTVVAKKKREANLFPADDRTLWADEVHFAFLEALQKHPPVSLWRFDDSCKDAPDEEQADYCRIIQEYILKKTGRPHSFEQISEQIMLVLSSPLATPIVKTPLNNESLVTAEIKKDRPNARLHETRTSTEQRQTSNSSSPRSLEPSSRVSESSSMSRRRKACNRPVLNLQVDIPPVTSHFASTEKGINPNLNPYSKACCPFAEPYELGPGYGSSPSTPLDQCHNGPLSPPEIPRITNVHHNKIGRWIPTPTEGVLPFLSYASMPSPLSSSSFESPEESSGNDSNATERIESRPRMTKRTLSWLSTPKCAAPTHSKISVLASPISAFSRPHEDNSVPPL